MNREGAVGCSFVPIVFKKNNIAGSPLVQALCLSQTSVLLIIAQQKDKQQTGEDWHTHTRGHLARVMVCVEGNGGVAPKSLPFCVLRNKQTIKGKLAT